MPSYNQLRTVSYRLSTDTQRYLQNWHSIKFPSQWVAPLLKLQADKVGRKIAESRIPVQTLNSALRALVPDLISIERNIATDKHPSAPWLYSTRPISGDALKLIVGAWAKAEFDLSAENTGQAFLSELKAAPMNWDTLSLDMSEWKIEPNGTAKPDSRLYFLWPDRIAAQLSHPDITLQMGKLPLRFRRLPSAPSNSHAELLSWPPQEHRGYFWSVCITISLQTVPFQSWPVLNCDLGTRRWASRASDGLPSGQTSVYLLTQLPWIEGLNQSSSFQVAQLRSRHIEDNGKGRFQRVWSDSLAEIVASLQRPRPSLPDPDEILANPVRFHQGETVSALIYKNSMRQSHPVTPGLPPKDRRDLAEQIEVLLRPDWSFTPLLDRVVGYRMKKNINPFARAEDKRTATGSEPHAIRKAMLKEVTGDSFTVEIHHQSSEVADALQNSLVKMLGLQQVGVSDRWHGSGLNVHILRRPLGEMGGPLPTANNGKSALEKAVIERAENLSKSLPNLDGRVAAFVELQVSFPGHTDPKRAIRLGLAQAGRVSQFIAPSPVSLEERSRAAALDLLRNLGLQPVTVSAPTGLPSDVQAVGLWMVKRTNWKTADYKALNVPVLVRIGLNQRQIWATAPGLEKWLPYADFLKTLANGDIVGYDSPKQALPVIRQILERELSTLGPTLLFCYAHNMRSTWPWLNNGGIKKDSVTFGNTGDFRLSEFNGLRIVRVRGPNNQETPQWYAQDGKEQGFSKGLFQIGERVFASTYGNPVQMKTNRRVSKLTDWESANGDIQAPRAEALGWNPRIYELTIAGLQPGDIPEAWAALAHNLRQATFGYEDATGLPLPLHLAKQTEEYALQEPTDHNETEG